jgi:hypothetical protein
MKKQIVSLLLFTGLVCAQIQAQEFRDPNEFNSRTDQLKNNNLNREDIKIRQNDLTNLEKAELIEELFEQKVLKSSPDKKTLEVDSILLEKLKEKGLLYDFRSDNGTICG